MGKPWVVEYRDAYASWCRRRRPNADEELELVTFLDGWTTHPPKVANESAVNQQTVGPWGHRIWIRKFRAGVTDPVAGYIYVMLFES